MSAKKSFLFIFQHAPHASLHAKEGFDFALSCAAFDQKVDVLFIRDGIYQLMRKQNTAGIQSKNHSATIDALALYGIENCFYEEDSANTRNIESNELNKACKPLNQKQCSDLISNYDFIFNY